MSDKVKNILKISGGIAVGVGTALFIVGGGTGAGASGIVTGAIAVVGAIVAIIALIKG